MARYVNSVDLRGHDLACGLCKEDAVLEMLFVTKLRPVAVRLCYSCFREIKIAHIGTRVICKKNYGFDLDAL